MGLLAVLALFPLFYLGVSFWLSLGLRSQKRESLTPFEGTITVVVAARDEETTLPVLLESLRQQSLPMDQWKVIVVDDRSSDSTAEVLKQWQTKMPNLSYISIEKTDISMAPKKYALSQALKSITTDLVITTDADCEVQPHWLQKMSAYFSDSTVGLVQGITLYHKAPHTILWLFQSLDFFSHSVVAAAGIGRSLPINSNANNFAYRTTLYNELLGYGELGKVISGDDDLFLQRVWEDGRYTLCFSKEQETLVHTNAVESWKELFEQRKRWGSKTMYYKSVQKIVLSQIFLFYIVDALVILSALTGILPWWMAVYYGLVKIVGELFFLLPAKKAWSPPFSLIHMVWGSFLQLFIVLYAVFAGVFGTFTWKGETFKRSR